jgi:hypothetical protein
MAIENDKITLLILVYFLVTFNQEKKNWNQYYCFLAKHHHLVTTKIKFSHEDLFFNVIITFFFFTFFLNSKILVRV